MEYVTNIQKKKTMQSRESESKKLAQWSKEGIEMLRWEKNKKNAYLKQTKTILEDSEREI